MKSTNGRYLSKSKYLKGMQCLRLLWVDTNDRQRIKYDEGTLFVMSQGQDVGILAQSLFPGGLDASTDNISENLEKTAELLSQRKPIYEAGVSAGPLYCRVDILRPTDNDAWDIIEVKGANSVKPENLHDVAFQRHCATMAGLNIDRCLIMHLNRDYVKRSDIEPSELFIIEEVTDLMGEYTEGLEERIDQILTIMTGAECPEESIGSRCRSPYECPLIGECWAHLPEHHPMTLYYGKSLGEKLLLQGINHIADIPPGTRLNGKQQIQCNCIASNQPHVDCDGISEFLGRIEYPLYFMDFETFMTAVPLYDGTSPYQQIPFQFSVHVVTEPGAEPRHYSFLADSPEDPRPMFIKSLTECMGTAGSVMVYYASFEKSRLEELRQSFPEYAERIDNIIGRMVDLIVPFQAFHYYHPSQRGSASLKYVMPALTELKYSDLEIREGGTASLRYFQSVFNNLSEDEVNKIRRDLEVYCGQDTFGMIGILDNLRGLISASQNIKGGKSGFTYPG